jgi:predicted acyltransferase
MKRFHSLDVFRGATVALMILVNNPGSWKYIYPPFEHAPWHGCTPTDLVFPFFLFAVGNAMAFVFSRTTLENKQLNGIFLWKITKRFLLIFLIGLLLNWFPFVKWSNWSADGSLVAKTLDKLRILGVLQRIALAYFFASLIVFFSGTKGSIIVSGILLLGYWVLCVTCGNEADPFSLNGYFGTAIDKAILGDAHMYHGEGVAFDPEGLTSTITAIVQVIFGYLAGDFIIKKGKTFEMVTHLFVVAAFLIFTAFMWDMVFPINKKIWTSSYVFYTTGLALMVISVLIYFIELKNVKGFWINFFEVFGKNPLFIFVMSGVWVKLYMLIHITGEVVDGKQTYTNGYAWIYKNVFQQHFGDYPGSLLFAIAHVMVFWAIGYLLDKKKIYIRV